MTLYNDMNLATLTINFKATNVKGIVWAKKTSYKTTSTMLWPAKVIELNHREDICILEFFGGVKK